MQLKIDRTHQVGVHFANAQTITGITGNFGNGRGITLGQFPAHAVTRVFGEREKHDSSLGDRQ
jgi:hypothetical protein